MTKYRKEVLDYMKKLQLRASIKWSFWIFLLGTALAWIMGMLDQIFFLWGVLFDNLVRGQLSDKRVGIQILPPKQC